jgi:hypothetical protein
MSEQLKKLKEYILKAEQNILAAKSILGILQDSNELSEIDFQKIAQDKNLSVSFDEEEKVIEGIFNGVEMVDSEGNYYPVPVNYASKSKLVSGDLLKLTIGADGRFLYKQIGPTERKYSVGPLTYEKGQYQVLAEGKTYKVLLASVTYFKAEIGDEVTIITPKEKETSWAAIDAVHPKNDNLI